MEKQTYTVLCEERVEALLEKAWMCSFAMSDGCTPYVLPMCCRFCQQCGRWVATLYSEPCGRKMQMIRRNPHVALLVHTEGKDCMESVTAFGCVRVAALHTDDFPGYPVRLEVTLQDVSGRMYKKPQSCSCN